MEFEPVVNRTFMARFERFEPLIKDSSMMVTAKTCLRKYFYNYVLAFVPRNTEPYFGYGSAYHKFREVLEQRYLDTINPNRDNLNDALTSGFQPAIEAAIEIYERECGNGPPAGTQWDFLTKDRLIASCRKAFIHWGNEKKSNKIVVVSVEQPFNVQLEDGSFTSGRADQIVRWNGKLWGRDFKTSSKEGVFYARGLKPNDQFTRYTFAESKLSGETVQGQIIEVLYNSKKKGPEISQYISTRTPAELATWERENMFFNKVVALAREADTWPMQEHNCGFCRYHSVCSLPTEASQMAKLESEFRVRPWDNTAV